MKVVNLRPEKLHVDPNLTRSQVGKQFAARLEASIRAIGLAEPLKVAEVPGTDSFVVVDGVLRLNAIRSIRSECPHQFDQVPAYLVPYDQRYEIRFQTDIYQDLLPSQLAELVEHLHRNDGAAKSEIADYLGISAPTLRNYTGLWRMRARGDLFARLVDLMDVGVIPSSNPFAWLRLTTQGVRVAIEKHLATDSESAEEWICKREAEARSGQSRSVALKVVEAITGNLPSDCYRQDAEVRARKRDLGLRRGKNPSTGKKPSTPPHVMGHLAIIERNTPDPVLQIAARSLQESLD